MPLQGVTIPLSGGLDLASSSFDLLNTPGAATRLKNFESSTFGGYRRISGYRKFVKSTILSINVIEGGSGYTSAPNVIISDPEDRGEGASATAVLTGDIVTSIVVDIAGSGYEIIPTVSFSGGEGVGATATAVISTASTPTGFDTTILGVYPYHDGVMAVQSTGIYFSTDGATWLQVNKDNASTGLTQANLDLEPALVRTSQAKSTFERYEGSYENDAVTIGDGINNLAHFYITDVGGTRKYYYQELTTIGKYQDIFLERLVVAGDPTKPNYVTWFDRYSNSVNTGASAGEVDVGDVVTGIKVFRNKLIIFAKKSIHQLQGLDDGPSLTPISRNIGCIDGNSIQEIGGDLIFLAPDGFRNIAGTSNIDDISLTNLSHKILPRIRDIVTNITTYDIDSTVLRDKDQYRFYYTDSTKADKLQKGLTGTLKASLEGGMYWEWSDIEGIPAYSVNTSYDSDKLEQSYLGDYNGNIHRHDQGISFDGLNISAEYKTPDIAYGDIGIRKTLYQLKLSIKPEGTQATSEIYMNIRYDYEDPSIQQPSSYYLGDLLSPALYGSAVYGTSKYGSPDTPVNSVNIEGSGFSNSFRFFSKDISDPYNIQGLYVQFLANGNK